MATVKPQICIYGDTAMETKRTPVPLTLKEREEIEAAMQQHGIRSMSDFLRYAALSMARKGAS